MTLGELIKTYREENGLSLRDLAKKSGISNAYLSMLETGRKPSTGRPIVPTLTILNNLAYAMNMRIDDLIALINDTPIALKDKKENELTPEEKKIIDAYRVADKQTRRLINYALFLNDEKKKDPEQ